MVLAAAAPAAAASGENPTFIAVPPFGTDISQVFGIQMSDLPALPPSAEEEYQGLLVDFCLPEGFRITSVTTSGWGFVNAGDNYDGGDAFVFNTDAISAGTNTHVDIVIGKDPSLGALSGTMEADVWLGSTGIAVPPLSWQFDYGTDGSLISCGSSLRLG